MAVLDAIFDYYILGLLIFNRSILRKGILLLIIRCLDSLLSLTLYE